MGNVLDAPITTKETEAGGGLGMRYAVSSMQGWRREMEDAHVGAIGLPGKADVSFFGVFDGHGGSTVSRTSAEKIVQTLAATPQYQEASDPTEWSRVFYSSIFRLDRALRTLMFHFGERSGSTAIMSLVTPSHIIVGNVGDSRCVMRRGGSTIALSEDHKPTKMGERRRIKRAGMTVSMQRVNGELAVSRALGDFTFKTRKDLPPDAQAVTCAPEIRVLARHPSDEFLLLCCDGIWDVMTSDEAVQFVREELRQHPSNPVGVMNNLINTCLQRGSRDNMTAMVVIFDDAVSGGSGVASASAPASVRGLGSPRYNGSGLPQVAPHSKPLIAFATPTNARSNSARMTLGGGDDQVGSAPMRLNQSSTFNGDAASREEALSPAAMKLFKSSPAPLGGGSASNANRNGNGDVSPATQRPSVFMPESGTLRLLAVRSAGASPKARSPGMPMLVNQHPRRNTLRSGTGRRAATRSRPGSSAAGANGRNRYPPRATGGSRRAPRRTGTGGGGGGGGGRSGASPAIAGALSTMRVSGDALNGTIVGSSSSSVSQQYASKTTYTTANGGVVDVKVSDLTSTTGFISAGGNNMFASTLGLGAGNSRPGSRAAGVGANPDSTRLAQTRQLYGVHNGPRSIRSRQASRQTKSRARAPVAARATSGWARQSGQGLGLLGNSTAGVAQSYPAALPATSGRGGPSQQLRPPRLKHLHVGAKLSDQGRDLLASTMTPADLHGLMGGGNRSSGVRARRAVGASPARKRHGSARTRSTRRR